MTLGKVIRKYRKLRNLTQEEMAGRLGVTAPAVNKWENENSYPDITLIAPIARLLGISLDTLLSFREELTVEEIGAIIREADSRFQREAFEEILAWAKKKLEEYPNCGELLMDMAVILDAQRLVQKVAKPGLDEYICSLYVRVLDSGEEGLRVRAADALVGFYMRKNEYEKAEKYLEYFSMQNPERKRKQAQIYAETGRSREAYRTYEELLFSDYQRASMGLHGMYLLAMRENDRQKARWLVDKQKELARCFEMGKYYEVSCGLELAALEQDGDAVLSAMEEMLSSEGLIADFRKAKLYEHMEFKEMRGEFLEKVKENLRKSFREEECFGFLKDDERWQALTGGKAQG